MKRILINATHAEEIRVALCNGNHLYDFDLENRTREQKKANIYKGHVTRVEPSLEAVFVEYGSARQGFLPIREIASDYLSGDPRSGNIKNLIKEGDELIVQIEKEERGNKGAALSTFVSLAGRYLVLMPNNPRGGGISRQISGKLRDEMKQILSDLRLPKGMSVIIRTAGIGKSSEDLQQDLDHLLSIWKGIQEQNKKYPSPRLVHQEAGVVTRAVRDYLRDDIAEIWVDNENAYNEAANFIEAVMPQQASKLRKYTDFEPMFARFGIEKQIETAYQREVRLPSGGSIVIDQTEALVSIDINSSKATKGADVSETAYNTNLEAADEIARQLRLRDMGGLIVIDFIDMATSEHQKQVENRLREATKNDRARIQFAEISRFGLLEMSRQRLRPSLEEATGFLCPRCHGNGMIRDLRSLALSIMRQIEQKALLERQGEVQAEVPTEIAAFLLNEKRDSLVYLEQDSGVRITILPHAHLESPNFTLTYNREGFAPTSYERISESEQSEIKDRGYDTNWHTEQEVLDSQIRQTSQLNQNNSQKPSNAWSNANAANIAAENNLQSSNHQSQAKPQTIQPPVQSQTPQNGQAANAVAWLSNLFAPTQQATLADTISSQAAAAAIEDIVNAGGKSLGIYGQLAATPQSINSDERRNKRHDAKDTRSENRSSKDKKERFEKEKVEKSAKINDEPKSEKVEIKAEPKAYDKAEQKSTLPKREPHSRRDSRGEKERKATLTPPTFAHTDEMAKIPATSEIVTPSKSAMVQPIEKSTDPTNVQMHVIPVVAPITKTETIQLSLDGSKMDKPAKANMRIDKTASEEATTTPVTHEKDQAMNPTVALIQSQSATTDVTDQIKVVTPPSTLATDHLTSPDVASSDAILTSQPVSEQAQNDATIVDVVHTEFMLPQPVTDIQVAPALAVVPQPGRAKNDPREVYKYFKQNQRDTITRESIAMVENVTDSTIHSVAQTAQKITGTVGQFIEQHLPDTLKDGVNVVSHFLEAMTIFGSKNNPSNDSLPPVVSGISSEIPAADTAKFDEKFGQFFRNYGFDAVSQADIDNYHQQYQPQNRFMCDAGSNDSQPILPTQRASNDPRGKAVTIAPSVNVTVSSAIPPTNNTSITSEVAKNDTAQRPTKSSKVSLESDQLAAPDTIPTTINYNQGSVGAWIVAKLGAAGQTMIADGKLVEAFLQASLVGSQTTNNTSSQTETAAEIPTLTASQSEAGNTRDDAENTVENAAGNVSKSKTTASSYKNMIESVAEQMSMGQSTILKLSTAKPVPKSRVRKEKTADKVAIKAPAKPKTRASKKGVESAVVTKVVKKSTESPDSTPNDDSSAS